MASVSVGNMLVSEGSSTSALDDSPLPGFRKVNVMVTVVGTPPMPGEVLTPKTATVRIKPGSENIPSDSSNLYFNARYGSYGSDPETMDWTYQPLEYTFGIPFGPGGFSIPILIRTDSLIEPTETFSFSLEWVRGEPISFTKNFATVTVINDDHSGQSSTTVNLHGLPDATWGSLLRDDIRAAVDRIADRVPGGLGSLDIQVVTTDLAAGVLASAAPRYDTELVLLQRTDEAVPRLTRLYTPKALNELKGVDNQDPDIVLYLEEAQVSRWYSAANKATDVDTTTLLAHEIMHGLGMAGHGSEPGFEPVRHLTVWDTFVRGEGWAGGLDAPSFYFTGDRSTAANGGSEVEVANPAERGAHLANSNLVMYYAHDGRQMGVSEVEAAILQDLGYGGTSSPSAYKVWKASSFNLLQGVESVFYNADNPDVEAAKANALEHYRDFGWREGRDPNPVFSTSTYLNSNPDVTAAGINPLEHYNNHGWREGRDPSLTFDTNAYLAHNGDVKAAGINPLEHYLRFGIHEGRHTEVAVFDARPSHGIDQGFYFASNPEVARSGMSAETHYRHFGWREGRDPNAYFDTDRYLAVNPDVKAAGVDPLAHYNAFGWQEARDTGSRLNGRAYLAANPDVVAAGASPLEHWLFYGINEGRSLGMSYGDDGILL